MTFSMVRRARQLEGWRRPIALFGSVLVHACLAVCLLRSTGTALPLSGATDPAGASGMLTVSLQRSAPSGPPRPSPPIDVSPIQALSTATVESRSAAPSGSHTPQPISRGRNAGEQDVASDNTASRAGFVSPPAAMDAAAGSDYQQQLLDHIEPFKRYPEEASRDGVRGVVELSFEIDRQGRLLGVWVAKTSGSASLDAAAVSTLRRSAPMPPIPAGLPDALSIRLPVEFTGSG